MRAEVCIEHILAGLKYKSSGCCVLSSKPNLLSRRYEHEPLRLPRFSSPFEYLRYAGPGFRAPLESVAVLQRIISCSKAWRSSRRFHTYLNSFGSYKASSMKQMTTPRRCVKIFLLFDGTEIGVEKPTTNTRGMKRQTSKSSKSSKKALANTDWGVIAKK